MRGAAMRLRSVIGIRAGGVAGFAVTGLMPMLVLGLPAAGAANAAPGRIAPAHGAALAPAAPGSYRPPQKILRLGMRGRAVRSVQKRLAALHYYPGEIDGVFGPDMLEAVWAFKEVQGISTARNADIVGPWMERHLIHPRLPKVLVPRGGRNLRIEVSLKHEVLVLYHHNKVELISHVSTGGGYYYCSPSGGCGYAITPAGNYRAEDFIPGWVTVPLGVMYNPVFFIGRAYAIHGETDGNVPLQPVSHGCVRIPMDIAVFFHRLIHISVSHGTPVYIRNR
jgi:peptidoglycan hydrolase-like protein with peptidoglycan-binding domain